MPEPIGEFELIARYFDRGVAAPRVELGIGDDCALIDGGPGLQWAVTTDMLVEGVHFLAGVDPQALGHKSLAVNLSDLAACGAQPRCFFLAIAVPRVDEAWLGAFTRGLFALADRHGCALAGGDTTRSPLGLTISITAVGEVPRGQALLRSGAVAGDELWVSGTLGDGALGLASRRGELQLAQKASDAAVDRLERPQPRVALGMALRGIATAAIDISDGLAGDLGHILERSRLAATVDWNAVPRSQALRALDVVTQQRFVLAGGDDYELLFTAPPSASAAVRAAGVAAGVDVTRIGVVRAGAGLTVSGPDGREVDIAARAFDHFRP
ncbi:MAG TPA: thiamine-phosphate kinase [Burkholderiaceae bacterium]|nr:thiamine-phosphate kinase [Burkholderiaceae bacterium]HQR70314.1 thiamine-phosphate kinase [Burkholderiaceae bacterium]